jgi:hypothetical protein
MSVSVGRCGVGVAVLVVASACGPDPEMRAACVAFIACANHYAETFDIEEPDTSDYAEGGPCDSDPDVGEVCLAQCRDHRRALADVLSTADEEEGPCQE